MLAEGYIVGSTSPLRHNSSVITIILSTPLIDPRVIEWLEVFARERSLEWRRDATGNCCIARPGSAGGEKAPPVVIQGKAEVL